jgi:xanthine dehydrogenase accessory factor
VVINKKILEFIDEGRCFAVALVLETEGSAPRKAGTKAIIEESGKIWGTLGGGKVEAEAQRQAVEACRSKKPVVFEVGLYGESREEERPICGGSVRILIDPAALKGRAAYAESVRALEEGRRGALLTKVSSGNQTDVEVRWISEGDVGVDGSFADAEELPGYLKKERPCLLKEECSESGEFAETFIEPVIPRPVLLIIGGGHIGQALAKYAALAGFDIAIIEDRQDYAQEELFPEEALILCGDICQEISDFSVTEDTYIVIVTRGHQHDAEALERCLGCGGAYVGMIGSKRKVALIRKSFIENDICTEAEFDRVFAPIGLDIGAETVEEIAVSILAEMISVRRNKVSGSSCEQRSMR